MMKIFKILVIAAAMAGISALTSCRHELCYNHFPTLSVSLTYEHEWERDYGMAHADNWDSGYHGFEYSSLRPDRPEWINLIRFSNGGDSSEHFLTPDGGNVSLNGDCTLLFYNGDTEYIVLSDMASLPDARASATSRSRSTIPYLSERHPDTRSTNPPDVLYSAFIDRAPSVAAHETKYLPVKMQPLVYTYVVRYEFEYGLQHVNIARGALGGMAESVLLRDGSTSDEATIILYDCEMKSYGCEAHVRSFGIPGFPDEYYGKSRDEAGERPYSLNLEVLLKNGKMATFNFDITDQMEKQPRGGVITVSGLRIEDYQNDPGDEPSGGFNVDLSDWGDPIDIDLPVGTK